MKYWLAPLGLLLSTSVLADGFYVGGSVGMSSIDTEEVSASGNLYVQYGNSGTVGSVYGGYRFDLDQLFVAVEGDVTFGNIHTHFNSAGISQKNTRKDVYSMSVLMGIPLSNTADIYGRLGYAESSFEVKELNEGVFADLDSKETGWVVGLGTQFQLNDKLSMRLDYRYTEYGNFKFNGKGLKYKNTEQHYTVGVMYSF